MNTKDRVGLYGKDDVLVPLEGINWNITVLDGVVNIEMAQVYNNSSPNPIESKFIFPIEEDMAIYYFKAEINGKVMEGKIMEKGKAEAVYNDALASGKTASLVGYRDGTKDYLNMFVGNLPAGQKATITLKALKKLCVESNEWIIKIPASYSPESSSAPYTWEITTKIEAK